MGLFTICFSDADLDLDSTRLGRDRSESVVYQIDASIVLVHSRCSYFYVGRNGGHLTAHPFTDFLRLQKEFGIDDALRGLEIERYTTNEILKILKEHRLERYVDWVPGGRLMLYFTDQEYNVAKADYEAAKSSGSSVDMVQWLSKEETREVSQIDDE